MTASILAAASEQIQPQVAALIIFGRDTAGTPHAAWFNSVEVELATKAAALMKYKAFQPITDEHRTLAQRLPRGRVFASGKAFAPFLQKALYKQILDMVAEATGLAVVDEPAPRDESKPKAAAATASHESGNTTSAPAEGKAPVSLPGSWDDIGLGSLVLATIGDDDGWWESIVIGIDGDVLKLKWQDYPEEGTILRRRGQLALLPLGQP